jgi:transposase-like protein
MPMPAQSTSKYSDEDRKRVLASYAVLGNQARVAEQEGIPRPTVLSWVNSDWGQEMIKSIRHETQDEMISSYTSIVKRNLKAQEDRLMNGDVVGIGEDGNELRQAVRYRDLVVGAGIAIDKIRLLSNQATSITVTDGALTNIAKQLSAFTIDKNEKVIEGDVIE